MYKNVVAEVYSIRSSKRMVDDATQLIATTPRSSTLGCRALHRCLLPDALMGTRIVVAADILADQQMLAQ